MEPLICLFCISFHLHLLLEKPQPESPQLLLLRGRSYTTKHEFIRMYQRFKDCCPSLEELDKY